MKRFFALLFIMAIAQYGVAQNILGSDHDFSGQGWSGGELCIVCHTPHNADVINVTDAPLWNHEVTSQTFVLYNSPTFDGIGTIGQPDASSKLCLSCHDGVTAVDNFGGMTNNNVYITGSANIGTDLIDDHPVSFLYDDALATTDGGLFIPSTTNSGLGGTIDADLLFFGKLQCASCHNVHDNSNGSFLVMNNSGSALCLTCHNK